MSSRNSWQNKQSARERLKTERARQARRSKLRRRLGIGAVAVAAMVAAAAGVVFASSASGSDEHDDWARIPADAAAKPLKTPRNVAADGITVPYGDPRNGRVLAVYEDPRCPICKMFEQADGDEVRALADQGKYRIEYHTATFLDRTEDEHGSKTALAALGAALDQGGVPKYLAYKKVLFENQPEEATDRFADTNYLLDLAAKVPGLKTPAFEREVREGTFIPWAVKTGKAFNNAKGRDGKPIGGTPSVLLGGARLNVLTQTGPVSPKDFAAEVERAR
ncbi:DsbA family protein [Streptantibioticus rubrisoli]|uniref:DsbA family protein n=1 Tax=Streptantibioticus rubrisoli TaxID=1387313 RepID=A0ABT1PDU6_9ACTN|nr:thioredoxin domain-containing protein [Streptantibioticus rubrisoli]MCQ4042403.1 DsbA family protein [Streptantibioticus rubrisoli]